MKDWDAIIVVEYVVRVQAQTYEQAVTAAAAVDPFTEGEVSNTPEVLCVMAVP